VVPDSTSWIFLDPIGTGRRRFSKWSAARAKPALLEHREIVRSSHRPDTAFYLALPFGNNARAIRELNPLYEFRNERRFERDGYAISLYRMAARASSQQ
jgi:hypothetical protein